MSRSVEVRVDRLLLEQGEFVPLEFLLQGGCLSYADYEKWCEGDIACLDETLVDGPEQVLQQLAQAENYLQRRGWLAEALRYEAWRRPSIEAPEQILRFSRHAALNEKFHRRYRRPQAHPQMDLFTDAPATVLINDIVQAVLNADSHVARQKLARLFNVVPEHPRLGELDRLIQAAETLNTPVDDIATELRWLQDFLTPTTQSLLGNARHRLLVPLWRRLSQALQDRGFDPAAPDMHASHTAIQALDWPGVQCAVEREARWQHEPVLVVRHARACEWLREHARALSSWFLVCWRFPAQADALATSVNQQLRQDWKDFQDIEPSLSVPGFPAWLLLRRPGFVRILTEPATDVIDCPESYRTMYLLQQDRSRSDAAPGPESLALRARLKLQDEALFEHFMAARR